MAVSKTLSGAGEITGKILNDDMAMNKISLFFVLAAFVSLVACNKEVPEVDNTTGENGKMKTEVIGAKSDANDTKATVAYGTGVFAWDNTDCVAFYVSGGGVNSYVKSSAASSISGGSASFSVSYADGGTRDNYAIYPYYLVIDKDADTGNLTDATNKVVLPSSYTLDEVSGTKTPCPMIAVNTGSSWDFKQLCALLNLTINDIPADTYKLTVKFNGNNVCGEFTVNSPSSAAPYISSERTLADDVITITSESAITTGSVVVNIPLPVGTYSDISVMAYDAEGNGTIAYVGTLRDGYTTQAMGRKKVGPRTIALNNTNFFSVADKKYVLFSPGNLQATYDGSNWTWHFAEHQYDFIGNGGEATVGNEMLLSESPWISGPGTVDMFGFSTADNYFGINSSMEKDENNKYTEGGYLGTYVEWGSNTIGNYVPNVWRTPTARNYQEKTGEWYYLFTRKYGQYYERWGHATVEEKRGVILIPDVFTDPGTNEREGYTNLVKNDTGSHSYTDNVYTGTNWTAMENAGAIFLPAVGMRNGLAFSELSYGHYWSSTPNGWNGAIEIYFASNSIWRGSGCYRHRGCSVRLVRDLN